MNDINSELLHAIEAGDSERALQVLAEGADPHGAPDQPRPLQVAARMGDAIVAAALIERGVDVNAQFPDANIPSSYGNGIPYSLSNTALIEAALTDGNPVLPLLIAAGADVNAHSDQGNSALFAAIGSVENMRCLLEAGADSNARFQSELTPISARTPLLNLFFYPPQTDEQRAAIHEQIKLLLGYGANPDGAANQNGFPSGCAPLSHALSKKDVTSVLLLLRGGANPENVKTASLALLASEGQSASHRELKAWLGANSLVPSAQQQNEALRHAALHGEIERVRLLLSQNADPNGLPANTRTALHMAAAHSRTEIVKALLQYGANPDSRDSDDDTPLHRAAELANQPPPDDQEYAIRAQESAAERETAKAHDPSGTLEREAARNLSWKTAHNLSTVRALIEAGADVDALNKRSRSALHYAARCASPAVVALLLESHAKVNAHVGQDHAPLHEFVTSRRRRDLVDEQPYLLSDALSQIGASADFSLICRVRENRFLLDKATADEAEVLQLLLQHGADVNQRGFSDYLPLMLASRYGTPSTVQTLIDAGAEVNATLQGKIVLDVLFNSGRTFKAFQEAGFFYWDFPDVIDELLEAGHNTNIALETVLSDANLEVQFAAREDVAVLRILLQAGALYASQIK